MTIGSTALTQGGVASCQIGSFQSAWRFNVIRDQEPRYQAAIGVRFDGIVRPQDRCRLRPNILPAATESLARIAIRCAAPLADVEGLQIAKGVFGQPLLRNVSPAGWAISVSHTAQMQAVLAFPEEHPMGIDVERLTGFTAQHSEIAFTLDEVNSSQHWASLLGQAHGAEIATTIWCAREALSKVLRTGLMCSSHVLETSELSFEQGMWSGKYTHFPQYKFVARLMHEHVLCVCSPRRSILCGALPATLL